LAWDLGARNLIVLRGDKGYCMCGYLNMKAANTFHDVAVKIVGVSSIAGALKATVHSCSVPARSLGIRVGQPIKDVLKIIA
jgi:uncharacterized protein YunC (DUF1805 family)